MAWIDEAKNKLTYLQSTFAARDIDFKQRDDIYALKHDDAFGWDAPSEKWDIRINTAEPIKLVRHISGLFLGNPMRLVATPRKRSKKRDETSGKLEKFLLGVLQENERRYGSVMQKGVANAGIRGWGSWRVTWNTDRENVDEDEYETNCPVEWQAVDPQYLYYEDGGLQERFASCIYSVPKRRVDVEREWGKSLTTTKKGKVSPHEDDADIVYLNDYWWWQGSKVWNGVWCNEVILKKPVAMPAYNHLAYITWFTQPEHTDDPQYWGTGWVHAIREDIKHYDQALDRMMLSQTFAASNMYYLKPLIADAPPVPEGYEMKLSPGSFGNVPYGYGIEPVVSVTGLREMQVLAGIFKGEMESVGLPAVATAGLSGTAVEGLAGVTMQGLMDAATVWLQEDVESFSTCTASICELIVSLCGYYLPDAKLSTTITTGKGRKRAISYVDLSGKDMQGYRLDVVVDTETAADKMRKQQLGMQLTQMEPQRCPFSLRTIQERYFDIDDPDGETERKLIELAENRPELVEYMSMLLARQYGLPEPPQAPATPIGSPGQGQPPPGLGGPLLMPGQGAMPTGGPGGMPPGVQPMNLGGPPPGLISPQAMGGSPPPMPVPPRPPMNLGGPGTMAR